MFSLSVIMFQLQNLKIFSFVLTWYAITQKSFYLETWCLIIAHIVLVDKIVHKMMYVDLPRLLVHRMLWPMWSMSFVTWS